MIRGALRLLLFLSATQAPLSEACNDSRRLWDAGKREEALQIAAAALERDPSNGDLRTCLAEYQLGVHRYEEVLDTLAPLGAAEGRPWRAQAHWMLGQYQSALPLLDPSQRDEALLIVQGLMRLGRETEADRELDRQLEAQVDPSFPWRLLQAQRSLRTGELSVALTQFEQLHREDSFDPEVLFGWGRALVRSGNRQAGLELLERHRRLVPLFDELEFALRGVDLEPRHAPGHARVGDIERAIGRLDRAEARYRRAWQLCREAASSDRSAEAAAQRVAVALRLARFLVEDRSQVGAACEVLAQAAQQTPDARLWVRLGDYRMRLEQAERAAEAYREAMKLRPQDTAIQERLRATGQR